jgi:hypothetical protein
VKINLGAEPKKVAILAGLLLVAAYLIYTNFQGDSPAPAQPVVRSAPAAPAPSPSAPPPDIRRAGPVGVKGSERSSQEFRPSLKPKRPEDRRDPAAIDPALRLDLLARLQNVKLEGGHRSLFEFSQPRPKTPEVKIPPKPAVAAAANNGGVLPGAPNPEAAAPPKPPPPQITLKFYGFISPAKGGPRRAFFLDGEEIYVAAEGELIKKRYKVVRIGANSAVLEDVEHQHQQTLVLEEQQT